MIKKVLLMIMITVGVGLFAVYLNGCNVARNAVTYVNFNLNPSVELILDTNNRVVSANAINDDGELLLSYSNFENKEIRTVIKELLSLACESGLLDVDSLNGLASIGVVNEDPEYANTLFENLKEVCNNYFKTNGIYALTIGATLPEEVIALAEEYQIPVGQLRIRLKLMEYEKDLTTEQIMTMPIQEVIKLLHQEFLNIGKIALKQQKESYKEALSTLRLEYEQNLKTLFGEEYVALLDELALLENQLEVVTLEELENLKVAIENKKNEIELLRSELEVTYQNEYNTLRNNYLLSKETLRNDYKEAAKTARANLKQTMQNNMNEKKARLDARVAFAKNRKNNFKSKYDMFLALKETDLINFIKSKLEELSINEDIVLSDLQSAIVEARKYASVIKNS